MEKNIKKVLYVDVPNESTDYAIDNFLGNTFQYKINNEWLYKTSISLPNGDLIIDVIEKEKIKELNLDSELKWISIQEI